MSKEKIAPFPEWSTFKAGWIDTQVPNGPYFMIERSRDKSFWQLVSISEAGREAERLGYFPTLDEAKSVAMKRAIEFLKGKTTRNTKGEPL